MVLVARFATNPDQNEGNVTFTLELKVRHFSPYFSASFILEAEN
jgi:hypothetical protein